MDISEFRLSRLPLEENAQFEFKSSLTCPKELKKKLGCAVSGFANSGGGTFVAGVWGLSEFSCQTSRARNLLVYSGMRPSYRMAKWFSACFQWWIGMVHFFEAS